MAPSTIQKLQRYLKFISICCPNANIPAACLDFRSERTDNEYSKVVEYCVQYAPLFIQNFVLFCRPEEILQLPAQNSFIILPYSSCNVHKYKFGVVDINGRQLMVERVLVHKREWIEENFYIPFMKERKRLEDDPNCSDILKKKINEASENPFAINISSIMSGNAFSSSSSSSSSSLSTQSTDDIPSSSASIMNKITFSNVLNDKNGGGNSSIVSSASYPQYFNRTNSLLKEYGISIQRKLLREWSPLIFVAYYVLLLIACTIFFMAIYIFVLELFVGRIGLSENSSYMEIPFFKSTSTRSLSLSSSSPHGNFSTLPALALSANRTNEGIIGDSVEGKEEILSEREGIEDGGGDGRGEGGGGRSQSRSRDGGENGDKLVAVGAVNESELDVVAAQKKNFVELFHILTCEPSYVAFAVLLTFCLVAWPLSV